MGPGLVTFCSYRRRGGHRRAVRIHEPNPRLCWFRFSVFGSSFWGVGFRGCMNSGFRCRDAGLSEGTAESCGNLSPTNGGRPSFVRGGQISPGQGLSSC